MDIYGQKYGKYLRKYLWTFTDVYIKSLNIILFYVRTLLFSLLNEIKKYGNTRLLHGIFQLTIF